MRKLFLHSAAKPVVFALCLLPLAWLVYAAAANQLGANPAESLIRATGDWTLRALCLVLAVTPLRVGLPRPSLRALSSVSCGGGRVFPILSLSGTSYVAQKSSIGSGTAGHVSAPLGA